MNEWTFAQRTPADRLALLHQYSVLKRDGEREIEFIITVREYHTPKSPNMKFMAQADKQTNQKSAPFTPCGWGTTLLEALSECLRAIDRFPYEG